ncbi:hypothetical protein P9911_029395 [Klebsiella oxytoca]|uniref:hypothetical protein n=1 Tax=Klebsiella oxytoca TaxID=571 RepID=UPI0025507107|nr:hypothetical protein [Klebsiella oxytoca]MEC5509920.1 hypothetical protein [Klebsiella oxytoca]
MTDIKKKIEEEQPEPCFLDGDEFLEIPHFITCTNAREMFGMTEDETVEEAMARHNAKGE